MPPVRVWRSGRPRAGWYRNWAAMYCVAAKFTTTSNRSPNDPGEWLIDAAGTGLEKRAAESGLVPELGGDVLRCREVHHNQQQEPKRTRRMADRCRRYGFGEAGGRERAGTGIGRRCTALPRSSPQPATGAQT